LALINNSQFARPTISATAAAVTNVLPADATASENPRFLSNHPRSILTVYRKAGRWEHDHVADRDEGERHRELRARPAKIGCNRLHVEPEWKSEHRRDRDCHANGTSQQDRPTPHVLAPVFKLRRVHSRRSAD
jgi:hypothetical protein